MSNIEPPSEVLRGDRNVRTFAIVEFDFQVQVELILVYLGFPDFRKSPEAVECRTVVVQRARRSPFLSDESGGALIGCHVLTRMSEF